MENTETVKTKKSDYEEHYRAKLYELYTLMEDKNGRVDIKKFCKESSIHYILPVLKKEGIIVNTTGMKGRAANWEWKGPIPTIHMARALLKRIHLSNLQKYPLPEYFEADPAPPEVERETQFASGWHARVDPACEAAPPEAELQANVIVIDDFAKQLMEAMDLKGGITVPTYKRKRRVFLWGLFYSEMIEEVKTKV